MVLSSLLLAPLPFPDTEARTFLREAEKILSEDPMDQPFRQGGLPTVHGRQYFDVRLPRERRCGEAWQALERGHFGAFVVHSQFEEGRPTVAGVMSGHAQLDWASLQRTPAHFDAQTWFYREGSVTIAVEMYGKRQRERTLDVDYAGDPARIYFRAIYPGRETRYSADSPIFTEPGEKGKPIAVLALIAVRKPGAS